MEAARTVAGFGCAQAGQVVGGRCGERCHEGIGHAGVNGAYAAQRAARAGDAGHEGRAAGEPRHLHAVSDKVGSAGNGYRASREAGARHGGALGGIHGISAIDAAGAVAGSAIGRVAAKPPQVGHGDDLRGVAAQNGRRILAHGLDEPSAQAADAHAHRVEHPGRGRGRAGARRGGNRLLVDGHERAQVDVDGPSQGGDALALVGQIHHGRRAADGQLGVGDEALGHGVGDRRRERVRLAHLAHGAGHERPQFRFSAGGGGGGSGMFGHGGSFPEAGALSCGPRQKRRSPQEAPLVLGEHAPYDSVS